MPNRSAFLAAVGVIAALSGGSAEAATIQVDSLLDGGSGCTLRTAIGDVDSRRAGAGECVPASAGSNTIVLPSGTITLGEQKQLSLTSTAGELRIVGSGEGSTTIRTVDPQSRVLEISTGAIVTLEDLKLTEAVAPGQDLGTDSDGNGGAIENAGSLTLIDAAITDSHAARGTYTDDPGDPDLGGRGGPGGSGGAIYNTGTLLLSSVTLADDRAGDGGYGGYSDPGPTSPNPGGAGGDGGGVANAGGNVTILASTLVGDEAGVGGSGPAGNGRAGSGGALWSQGGTVTVIDSTFAANTAGVIGPWSEFGESGLAASPAFGGAIGVDGTASMKLRNDTIAGNTATGVGGGVSAEPPDTAAYPLAGVTFQNVLLASNTGGNCAESVGTREAFQDLGHNLSYGGIGCPSSFLSGNPNLGTLQDNGGQTETMDLGPGSAAIGQVPAGGAGCPGTDQRGVPRPGPCSIGAYQPVAPTAHALAASHVLATSAQLNASVALYSGAGTIIARWDSAHQGKSTTTAFGPSVATTPYAVALTGLRPATEYRYLLTVVTADGTTTSNTIHFKTRALPTLSALELSLPQVSYRDSQASTTAVELQRCTRRKHGHCTRYRTVIDRTHHDRTGRNEIDLGDLPRGTYRLHLTPQNFGVSGPAVTKTFAIRRRG